MPHRVHPVPGVFVTGVPAVVTEVRTNAEADDLVATGAFTHAAPKAAAAKPRRAKRSRARTAVAPAVAAPTDPEPVDATPAAETQEA